MKTFTEIETEFNTLPDIGYQELSYFFDGESDYVNELAPIFGNFKVVQEHGGEGQGEDWYQIAHLTDHDIYVKLDAYYYSYDGVQWDGASISEVKPKTETRTIYE